MLSLCWLRQPVLWPWPSFAEIISMFWYKKYCIRKRIISLSSPFIIIFIRALHARTLACTQIRRHAHQTHAHTNYFNQPAIRLVLSAFNASTYNNFNYIHYIIFSSQLRSLYYSNHFVCVTVCVHLHFYILLLFSYWFG